MRTSCAFYRESLSDSHQEVFTDCKILLTKDCDKCKFYKTWMQYNAKKVEADIEEYGRTHK